MKQSRVSEIMDDITSDESLGIIRQALTKFNERDIVHSSIVVIK